MPFRTFAIPVTDDGSTVETLNQFLRRVKVVAIEKHLITQTSAAVWAFCIDFQDGASPTTTISSRPPEKVDYRAILPPETFAVFARLRTLRKKRSEEAGVPLYAVITNEQMAEIAKHRPTTIMELRAIDGIGGWCARPHDGCSHHHNNRRT